MAEPTREALTEVLETALRDQWLVFRHHLPVGEYLPTGQLDGDCRGCGRAWPCYPVLDVLTDALLPPAPPIPRVHTQEENIAFRKDWDRRYAEGKQRAEEA